jgi:hypothetical protein
MVGVVSEEELDEDEELDGRLSSFRTSHILKR